MGNVKLPEALPNFKVALGSKKTNEYLDAYAAELRRLKMTREVNIKAIGVWDTVGSLGLPVQPWLQEFGMPTTLHNYRFFDTGIDDHVENAFHVLALDEHRSAFSPAVWSKEDNGTTNLKQVWVPGVHSNCGGGTEDTAVSDICLAWMMDQLSSLGEDSLEFNPDYLREQANATRKAYEDRGETWRWGLGRLNNSMKFPTNLAGSIIRTPLDYHVTDYNSGRALPDKLKNTHELMHPCVRARYELDPRGKSWDGRSNYDSDALKDKWEITPKGKEADGKPKFWQSVDKKRQLAEEKLGFYENILLDMDQATKIALYGSK